MRALPLLLLLAACGDAAAPDQVSAAPAPAETTGLDPALMAQALVEAKALPRLRSLVVLRDGREHAAHRLAGPPLDTPVNIKSASKTILSALT